METDSPDVLQEKARAVECFLGAAQAITNSELLTDEQIISAMVIATVVWTKMALLTGKYDVSDDDARDDLVRLINFVFEESEAETRPLQ